MDNVFYSIDARDAGLIHKILYPAAHDAVIY